VSVERCLMVLGDFTTNELKTQRMGFEKSVVLEWSEVVDFVVTLCEQTTR
jgi:hypothetical protein